MIKQQQLIEIQKRKLHTLEEVSELEEKFVASVSFLFFDILYSDIHKCIY